MKPGTAAANGDALVVPERRRGRHPPGEEIRDSVEADGDRVQPGRVAARPGDDRAQDGAVAGNASDADGPPGELTRIADAGGGDHGGQWSLHDAHDPDDVLAAGARQREIMNVKDREIGSAGFEQADRVSGGRRRDDAQPHAGADVVAAGERLVDARVHGVRCEVQNERGARQAGPGRGRASASREARGGDQGGKDETTHRGGQHRTPSRATLARDSAGSPRVGVHRRLQSWGMRRRVTFSRNYALSLSRTCRCYCKYCAFATHQPHLHAPDAVEEMLDRAASRHRAKELLILTGEAPDHNAQVAQRLAEYGFEDFTTYVVWVCERALERGMLPHTNLGVIAREQLAALREVTASQGLMLESVSERLMETVHAGSPTKHPARRLETIAAAGELKIPFTSGILVGIGETEEERMASLAALAEVHARYGHLQEVILQNFVPHQSYYGREPAEIAGAAAEEYWRTGVGQGPELAAPGWACPVSVRRHEASDRRDAATDARRGNPGPPEPRRLVARARAGRRHRPGRSERQRRPHLPRASLPIADPGPPASR